MPPGWRRGVDRGRSGTRGGAALHEWPPGCVTHRGSAGGGAWSPTAVGCVGEAVRAVLVGFTDTSGAAVVRDRVHAVTAESDEDVPASLLEEVSYRMDADDEIPLDAGVGRSGPVQTTGACRSASGSPDAGTVVAVGAVPKAVSLHGLQSRDDPGGWTCRVTLDVWVRRPGRDEIMALTVALAGDTMLGRCVAEELRRSPAPGTLVSAGVRQALARADLFVLNLECCVSDRGLPWPDPWKAFFFRAPPVAATVLAELGADCVTLANNHALDYEFDAMTDTLTLLAGAGVRTVGAGVNARTAREFAVLEAGGVRLAVVGVTDHPEEYAAGVDSPGVAWADLHAGVPGWLTESVGRAAAAADVVLVTPHWGPNMTSRPPRHVSAAAPELLSAGATLVAGHSAHVFHGIADRILFDLGDFVDDYAVDPVLRNDLGLLFLVILDGPDAAHLVPVRVEAVPLTLDYCHTRLASGEDREWIRERLTTACAEFGTTVADRTGRLTVDWR
ncbi:archease [Streptomyces sp. NPDC057684]|uniref:archease n=1 Tax=Streptomyces sp. NPDC057684 TaxID=3346211 RepID=UPI0036C7A0C9